MNPILPRESADEVARLARRHLEAVVAIDSAGDESSATSPSTPGQARLADELAVFFEDHGCRVEQDEHANVVAALDGHGELAAGPPLALLVHLDTTPGTVAVPKLFSRPRWDGSPVPYPSNQRLTVDVATYPAARAFLGHELLFGPGDRPFGLDDKLGLAQLMTLVALLGSNAAIPHPPLLLVARPDEELGRMDAVAGVARLLRGRDVRTGYTLDGIEPFAVNVENFNAAEAVVTFASRPLQDAPGVVADPRVVRVAVGGVNTHGCTAKAEGHRNAVRLLAEVVAALARAGVSPRWVVPHAVESAPHREVDAQASFLLGGPEFEALAALEQALSEVVGPHEKRGASWSIDAPLPWNHSELGDEAVQGALRFVLQLLRSEPGFPVAAEDSDGRDGYSNPFRITHATHGVTGAYASGVRVHVRLRDFDPAGRAAREAHVRAVAQACGAESVEVRSQYANLGPRLADRPDLVRVAQAAAAAVGEQARVQPIRGGTGTDPFLDSGIGIANLGTGYFAPESEKEFTSLELMARHVAWLVALVQTTEV